MKRKEYEEARTPIADNKYMAKKRGNTGKKYKKSLTLKNKLFCKYYATDVEFFGNGVQSYIKAYGINTDKQGSYSTASSSAKNLLKKHHILAYINEIMSETGFSDQFADKQLSFLMTQNAELGTKLGAIREFNALKKRIIKKMEHSGPDGKPIPMQIVDFGKL